MTGLLADRFETFGTSHLTVLAICAVGIVAIVGFGRRAQGLQVRRLGVGGDSLRTPDTMDPAEP